MVKFCHKTYTCVAFPLCSFISLHTLRPSVWNPSPFCQEPFTLLPGTFHPSARNPLPFCPKPFTLLLETLYPFARNPFPFCLEPFTLLPGTLYPFARNPLPFCLEPFTLPHDPLVLPTQGGGEELPFPKREWWQADSARIRG